ncbi:unnamed protein product [Arctogadus glacialis]
MRKKSERSGEEVSAVTARRAAQCHRKLQVGRVAEDGSVQIRRRGPGWGDGGGPLETPSVLPRPGALRWIGTLPSSATAATWQLRIFGIGSGRAARAASRWAARSGAAC